MGHKRNIGFKKRLKVFDGVAHEWYGKRYDDLSMEQKRDIRNFIRAGESVK